MKKGNTTIVPIDDKTLYNKDKKVNGLIKQLSSYTSVQGVSVLAAIFSTVLNSKLERFYFS